MGARPVSRTDNTKAQTNMKGAIYINKLTIIGNLTKEPATRTTPNGFSVCSFTVAVNRRKGGQDGQAVTDYFNVSAWRQLGENCQKYLAKGKKVCVIGSVTVQTYQDRDGQTRASLVVTADDIEFLSPRGEGAIPAQADEQVSTDAQSGFEQVEEDDLPF